jgi:hypothetical protein
MTATKELSINADARRQTGTLNIASRARFRAHLPDPNGNLSSIRNTTGVSGIHG